MCVLIVAGFNARAHIAFLKFNDIKNNYCNATKKHYCIFTEPFVLIFLFIFDKQYQEMSPINNIVSDKVSASKAINAVVKSTGILKPPMILFGRMVEKPL